MISLFPTNKLFFFNLKTPELPPCDEEGDFCFLVSSRSSSKNNFQSKNISHLVQELLNGYEQVVFYLSRFQALKFKTSIPR